MSDLQELYQSIILDHNRRPKNYVIIEQDIGYHIEGLILDELADSALFALRFRQNAARALMMPRGLLAMKSAR